MVSVTDVLIALLLVLGAVLLVFSIIICIKLIYTVDKVNVILTDMEKKLKSVNGLFSAVDVITDAISSVSDTFVAKTLLLIDKIFKKKK